MTATTSTTTRSRERQPSARARTGRAGTPAPRPWTAAAVGLAACLALAGCTSSGTPSAAPSSTGTGGAPPVGGPSTTGAGNGTTGSGNATTPTPAGPGRCTAAVLRGEVHQLDSAAGNRYADLVVTNTGATPCTLYGYGGLQLLDAAGHALPTTALRDEPPTPTLVTLAPNGTAVKRLHWGVVPTGTEPVDQPCEPDPASLSIIPPDETEPFTVAWSLGPVCAGGTFHASAYHRP
jgi:hypothetical protein